MSQKHINMLGMTVRDRVTGFTGVVSSISFDLYGCIQAAVNPPVDEKGALPDGRWFDIHRLEVDTTKPEAMPVPKFDKLPSFGASPATHKHGPAEKPSGKRT